eukprot:gnl/Trimastix_PCT/541.p1 GENE.gnl/Trimastix_PCT/541~~gnl/Trimastix_PCT/541.p1  ORF type:complete len:517 (+),score=205.51 gnl/Trimastix_PCT/541:64-1614(+)
MENVQVIAPNVRYEQDKIVSDFTLHTTELERTGQPELGKPTLIVKPVEKRFVFETDLRVPKTGMMLVGWGGNNGSTVTAGLLANRLGIEWRTKEGIQRPNFYGSVTQCSTLYMGLDDEGRETHVPFNSIIPMVNPNDIVIGGWDINSANMAEAMQRAEVMDYDLQRQLYPHMENMQPLPSIYIPDFIAANQGQRANNVLTGTKMEMVETIRQNIRDFKAANHLDRVVILWTANTERYSQLIDGVNDTAANLMAAIERGHDEISPSTLMAVASVLEHCPYINGSPQNTFVPGLTELAIQHNVHIAGDDFKSGQTKLKSVLSEFLVSAGLKPTSIVSYNHLGNNDGRNLSAPSQFRSKEISKGSVVDDVVHSNPILYPRAEGAKAKGPDHVIVIKYVPYVGDSKRAMDEYTSEIFMGGRNTLVIHNTCEDSLLAAPIIMDLVILAELAHRIRFRRQEDAELQEFHPVLSMLAYLCKAPQFPQGQPVVNALNRQRACLENLIRACVGLQPNGNFLQVIN